MGFGAGAAIGLLSRGRFGMGGAISAVLGAAFAKQLLHDGTKLAAAAHDAWESPDNMAKNKEVFSSTVGNFVVDTAAFTVGGVGAARLARVRTPSREIESRSSNIAYDQHSAAERLTLIPEPLKVDQELRTLLGYESPSTVKGLKTSIDTTYGTAQLRSHFSKSTNSLSMQLESPTNLRPPRIEFQMDAHGRPTAATVHDDLPHFVPSLFQSKNLPHLAEATGRASGDFVLAERFGKLDWKAATEQLHALRRSAGEPLTVRDTLQMPATHVAQKSSRVAPINEPLGTTDLSTCSALAIIDRAGGKHLLAHTDYLTNADLLRKSLSQFDLKRAEIYILEGEGNAFSGSIKSMGSAERILAALGNDPAVLRNVRFIEYAGNNRNANVVLHGGKLYADAIDYRLT